DDLVAGQTLFVAAPPPTMGAERVDEEGLPAEEGLAPVFAVPTPQHRPVTPPAPCTSPEAWERDSETEIEPDDEVGPLEHEVTELSAVVAVDDPGVAGDRVFDAGTELVIRVRRPVRAPVQRVELDVGHIVAVREPARQRRLAGA